MREDATPSRSGRGLDALRRLHAVRTSLTITVAVLGVMAVPSSASAHGGGGSDATNFRTTVLEVGDAGLTWRVYAGDALLELTNRTGREVTVIGYREEPYLRFSDDGVFENRRSPTTYLNRTRDGGGEVPAEADPTAPPQWRRVADGDRFAWHDHRAHWMAPTEPPMVDADPGQRHVVFDWTLPVELGGPGPSETVTVAGRLEWVPGYPVWPPMLGMAAIFLAVMVGPVFLTLPVGNRWPAIARSAAVLVFVVAAANAVRVVDDVRSVPATFAQQAVLLIAAGLALLFIVAMAVLGWRGTAGGMLALGVAGMAILLVFAADSTDQLTASQIATSLPGWVRRWTVAASWMIIIPAFLAAGLGAMIHARHLRRTASVPADVPG